MKLFQGTVQITKLPFTLPNGMRALRFVEPSRAWPSGKVILNNGRENFIAAPPAVGLELRNA